MAIYPASLRCGLLIIISTSISCAAYQMNCSEGYFMVSSNLCLPLDARCSRNQLYFNNNCHAITLGSCSSGEISVNNRCCSIGCITNCLQVQTCSCCNVLEAYGNLCGAQYATMSSCTQTVPLCAILNIQPCQATYSCSQGGLGSGSGLGPGYGWGSGSGTGPGSVSGSVSGSGVGAPPCVSPSIPGYTPLPPGYTSRPPYTYPTPKPTPPQPSPPSATQPFPSTYPTPPNWPIPSTHYPTYPYTTPTPPTPPHYTPHHPGYNCSKGTIYMNGKCHTIYCPYGSILQNDRCIIAQCPDGTVWDRGHCVLPQPIEHNILINTTITNQFNGTPSQPDITINTYNHLNVNASVNLDLNGGDHSISLTTKVPHSTVPDSTVPDSTVPDSIASNGTTDGCCTILSPRICKPKDSDKNHWICTSRRQRICGPFCTVPMIILIPPFIRQHQYSNVTGNGPAVIMPPLPNCSPFCPSAQNYYDCSGCGIGRMEFCSNYCYHYDCPVESCRYYEQQTYCAENIGHFGCQYDDGCYYDDWC